MAERTRRADPRVLGLTGPIACGKSTVGDILLTLGALERIDADRVVHQLMAPDTSISRRIADEFGADVLRPDGGVDRGRLAKIVFSDQNALRRLESIVHPEVRRTIRQRIQELAGQDGVIVIDAVLLLQSDLLELCDAVWVVQCAPEEQRRRLTQVRRMTEEAAAGRLAAQPSYHHPAVTTVIENSGSLDDLRRRVESAWRSFLVAVGSEG